MEVVINSCYGGFSLSVEAIYELVKMNSDSIEKMSISEYSQDAKTFDDYWKKWGFNREPEKIGEYYCDGMTSVLFKDNNVYFLKNGYDDRENIRNHPDVIKVIKKLGKKADGRCANLKIIEIPDDIEYIIEEYDGHEHVAEKHRTWY